MIIANFPTPSLVRFLVKKSLFKILDNKLCRNYYKKSIAARAVLPLTSIEKLSQHINVFLPYTNELHKPNDFYSHAKILKQYLNLPVNYQFKFIIEHGVILSKYLPQLESEAMLPSILTMSRYRKGVLKKNKKHVFSIGPYIHYSKHYLNTVELSREKKRLGKCLLLLPSHSTLELKAEYNIKKCIKKIEDIAKDFNSVRVCLYWQDVLHNADSLYKKAGFECVTAGHILDPLFLPRLKSIIETSTLTLSTDPGTHVGYCVFLKKPHIILPSKHKVVGRKSEIKSAWNIFKSRPYREVVQNFSKIDNHISDKQRKIVDKYWGTNEIKSKKELKKMIYETEKNYLRK